MNTKSIVDGSVDWIGRLIIGLCVVLALIMLSQFVYVLWIMVTDSPAQFDQRGAPDSFVPVWWPWGGV